MKTRTLQDDINTIVRGWKNYQNSKVHDVFWDQREAYATAINAIENATPETINAMHMEFGMSPLSIHCTECGEEKQALIVFSEDDGVELCPDCLRDALAMYDQVKQ
jgi:hypothetical protein